MARKLAPSYGGHISFDKGIFGGTPHISGVRLSVVDVLGQLHNLGSVSAVCEYYSHTVNEKQVKAVLAYTYDVMENLGSDLTKPLPD